MRRQVLGLLLTAASLTAAGCTQAPSTESTDHAAANALKIDRVEPVRREQITEQIELVGSLVPLRYANIVADVDGVITRIPSYHNVEYELAGQRHTQAVPLDIGHRVSKGDVLAEIDSVDFQLALDVANANLDLARKELANLKAWTRKEEVNQTRAQMVEAQAVFERAESDLRRAEQLLGRKVISQGEFDSFRMSYRTAAASLDKATAALAVAEAGPTLEEIAVAEARVAMAQAEVELRSEKLAKCTIHAPYDALVVERYVGVGDRVTAMPRVEIMQIIDPSILFAQVSVPERLAGRIAVGQMAVMISQDGAEQYPAVVGLVNRKIETKTRTFRVRVAVDNRQWKLVSGTFVHVRLAVDSAPNALVVPAEAVAFSGGNPAVWLVDDRRVKRQPVSLGLFSGTHYQIAGVTEGQPVVVGNTSLLSDGAHVDFDGESTPSTPVEPAVRQAAASKPPAEA